MIDNGRLLNHPRYIVKASNFGATESLFKQSEALVGGEFCVPHCQGQGNLLVQSCQDLPCQVLHDIVVLVLSATVVSMQMDSCFIKVVCA